MDHDILNQIDDDALDQVSGGTGDLGASFEEFFRDASGVVAAVAEVVTNFPRFLSTWLGGG